MKFIIRYSLDTVKRVAEFAAMQSSAQVTIVHGDSRSLEIPLADGVVTSPPYVGLIDYHDQHAYAYALLGLANNSMTEIGSASRGNSKRAQQEYSKDITQVFRNCLKAMPRGGPLIVVAHDRLGLYEGIAQSLDMRVEGVVQRHVNRRTGRRSSEFYESVFIWRKR